MYKLCNYCLRVSLHEQWAVQSNRQHLESYTPDDELNSHLSLSIYMFINLLDRPGFFLLVTGCLIILHASAPSHKQHLIPKNCPLEKKNDLLFFSPSVSKLYTILFFRIRVFFNLLWTLIEGRGWTISSGRRASTIIVNFPVCARDDHLSQTTRPTEP